MPKFIYVQAIIISEASGPGSIRFRHTLVNAANEDEAYGVGGTWSDEHPPHPGLKARHPHGRDGYDPDHETINDYVIELP